MVRLKRSRISPIQKTLIENEDNPKIVDDSGYVPLSVLVARFERSGELKQMYERLRNPNSSLDKVIEDFSMLEEKGDSLEVMAFAKSAMDKIRSANPGITPPIPLGRDGTEELANDLCSKL